MIFKYFPLVCDLPFHFLKNIFGGAKGFTFNETQFINIFSFMNCAFGALSKKKKKKKNFA
jgi:hypothetical protein